MATRKEDLRSKGARFTKILTTILRKSYDLMMMMMMMMMMT